MSNITITGLGSGIDTDAIVTALVALERRPIDLLESKKALAKKKVDLLGTLKGYVNALKTAATALSKPDSLLATKVTSSIDGIASFSASGSAAVGSHTLLVQQLATSDRWAFDGTASATTNLATVDGQGVSFTYDGVAYNATVTAAASSLNDVAAAINAQSAGKVAASVVNTGTTLAPNYVMVLTGAETGNSHRISGITNTVAGLTIDSTPPDVAGVPQSTNNLTVATNSIAVIDGLTVTRETNAYNDVIAGVSISVLAADPNPLTGTANFTVESDQAAIKDKVEDFIKAYNQVAGFIHTQNTYSEDAGAGGDLFGDSTLNAVKKLAQDALFVQPTGQQFVSDPDGFGTLRLIGVKVQTDGSLLLDDTIFDAKLKADPAAVADLFGDSDGFDNGGALAGTPGFYVDQSTDHGLADRLSREIDRMMKGFVDANGKSYRGTFDQRTDALGERMKSYDKDIAAKEARIVTFQDLLTRRFAALEGVMALLNTQSTYLNNAVSSGVFSSGK